MPCAIRTVAPIRPGRQSCGMLSRIMACISFASRREHSGDGCPYAGSRCRVKSASRLLATDVEVLRLHYAETLRHWRWRFPTNRDPIASLYDERFCRMFDFTCKSCELAFRHASL